MIEIRWNWLNKMKNDNFPFFNVVKCETIFKKKLKKQ